MLQKAPGHAGRYSSKTDSRGPTPVERSATRETDEDSAAPNPSSATPRPIHTSASSASSSTSRLKHVRASEDNSSRAESVARNFEELIHSNQTISYTLTPENMRDIDSKRSLDGPVVTKVSRKSEEIRVQQTPRSSPTASEAPKSPLSHHPVSPSSSKTGDRAADRTDRKSPGPIPRAPTGLAVSTGRAGGPEARGARTQGESTADFADFIKYTGPAGTDPSPLHSPPKAASSHSKSGGIDSQPLSPALGRGDRHKPREPTVDNRADTSDLIDFIRQGPPASSSSTSGHRIPRHVAPFRSTMDSDQLAGAVGGMAVDANIPEIRYSQGSTNMTEHSMPSMQSSINSNSALLHKGGAGQGAGGFDDDVPMPKRKQRRVRDPYAIDLSDEDDDDGFAETPRAPARKEESLAEFLRNYEPPPEPPSEPPRLQPKKKAGAQGGLMGRFSRNGNRDQKDAGGTGGHGGGATRKGGAAKPELPPFNERAPGKGNYIPIQVSVPAGYDMYGPTENGQMSRPRMGSM